MPSVANGYIGTVIYSDTVHVSGVYNGRAYPKKYPVYPVYLYQHAHRARIPSTASMNFRIDGIQGKSSYALDVSEGVFYKWFKAVNLTVEQRIYAHRTRKNLLVVEITAKNDARRNFSMSLIPNMGYVTRDIHFFMTESDRSEALAATGLVCLSVIFLHLCNKKSLRWKKAKMWAIHGTVDKQIHWPLFRSICGTCRRDIDRAGKHNTMYKRFYWSMSIFYFALHVRSSFRFPEINTKLDSCHLSFLYLCPILRSILLSQIDTRLTHYVRIRPCLFSMSSTAGTLFRLVTLVTQSSSRKIAWHSQKASPFA